MCGCGEGLPDHPARIEMSILLWHPCDLRLAEIPPDTATFMKIGLVHDIPHCPTPCCTICSQFVTQFSCQQGNRGYTENVIPFIINGLWRCIMSENGASDGALIAYSTHCFITVIRTSVYCFGDTFDLLTGASLVRTTFLSHL